MQHQFIVTLQSPDNTTAKQAVEALLEAVLLGRNRMLSASKDEVAIRYLETKVIRVDQVKDS